MNKLLTGTALSALLAFSAHAQQIQGLNGFTGLICTGCTLTNPVITGGTIDNSVIGKTTAAAGAFTTLTVNTAIATVTASAQQMTFTFDNGTVAGSNGATGYGWGVFSAGIPSGGVNIDEVAYGRFALHLDNGGRENTAIGDHALANCTTCNNNTALGSSALPAITSGGTFLTALGVSAMQNANGNPTSSVGVGTSALNALTTGAANDTAVGHQAGFNNTTGTGNTDIGAIACNNVNSGSNNTCVGYQAGALGSGVSTGSKNTLIGAGITTSLDPTNVIAIGYGASVTSSNSTVIGTNSTTSATIYGNLSLPGNLNVTGTGLFNGGGGAVTVGISSGFQVNGLGTSAFGEFGRWSADANGPGVILGKSRGGAVGTFGAVLSGDQLGQVPFYGDNGTSLVLGANILAVADGAVSGSNVPGRIEMHTVSSAGVNMVTMNLDSAGRVQIANGGLSIGTSAIETGGLIVATGTSTAVANSIAINPNGAFVDIWGYGPTASTHDTMRLINASSNGSIPAVWAQNDPAGNTTIGAGPGTTTLSDASIIVSTLSPSTPVYTDAGKHLTSTAPTGYSAVLSGTSGSIGGSALLAGACSLGTTAVTGATTSMIALADPNTYPGDGAYWDAYVSSANTVTVKVCATVALTPTASTYNVRIIQ